jgi:predicted transcriptional regulator
VRQLTQRGSLRLKVTIDDRRHIAYPDGMAAPAKLLEQLLALGESQRVEIAHALLDSVDDHDGLSETEREKLHAAIERSLKQVAVGEAVPLDEALAWLRARRARQASR